MEIWASRLSFSKNSLSVQVEVLPFKALPMIRVLPFLSPNLDVNAYLKVNLYAPTLHINENAQFTALL